MGGQDDRIDDHEKQAHGKRYSNNMRKISCIKEIWAAGHEIVKKKVAYFEDESDAYTYEWGMINVMCYAGRLTNAQQKSPKQERKIIVELPEIISPICISSENRRKVYHCVTNPLEFTQIYGIRKNIIKALLDGEYLSTWRIIPCDEHM